MFQFGMEKKKNQKKPIFLPYFLPYIIFWRSCSFQFIQDDHIYYVLIIEIQKQKLPIKEG